MYELKEIDCRLKIRKIYNCLLIHDNCLIIHITLTKLATKFLVSRVFFFVFSPQNKSHGLRVERGRTMETGDKNRGLTGASICMFCGESLGEVYAKDLELFQNRLVHEFYPLKVVVTLEQLNLPQWSRKRRILISKMMVRL